MMNNSDRSTCEMVGDQHNIGEMMSNLSEEQRDQQLYGRDVLEIADALKYAAEDSENADKAIEKIEEIANRETAADKFYNTHKAQIYNVAKMALEYHKVPLVVVIFVSKGVGEFKIRYISNLDEKEKKNIQSQFKNPIEEQNTIVVKHEGGSYGFYTDKR